LDVAMATYRELWDQWLEIADVGGVQDLAELKDNILASLRTAQDRGERQSMSGLLATVQNRIFGLADRPQRDVNDELAEVLKDVKVGAMFRGCRDVDV